MPKYMISFNDGDMKFPEEDFPAVGAAAHAVMREAFEKGHWMFGGGFMGFDARVVDEYGAVTPGPIAQSDVHIGGFCVLEVANDDEANKWAQKFAVACRCSQEVRMFMEDKLQDKMRKEFR